MGFIPTSAEEIDAAWLGEAIAPRHPGVRVASVEIVDAAEVTNAHAWLRVRYEAGSEPGPTSLFAKMLPGDQVRRQAIAQTRMGIREALFYESLAPKLSMRIPEAHVVRHQDDEKGAFVLLLEDLNESGCRMSSGPESPSPDTAAAALEDLAAMHLRFEDESVRAKEAGWVPPPDPPSDYGSLRLQEGLDRHRGKLTDAFAEMAAAYIEKRDAFHEVWHAGPQTVIHGDTHIGNLFFEGEARTGRIGFLDWGLVVVSTPLRDVSYFVNMCLSVEDRRKHERDLIRHYLDVRNASASKGTAPISFDEAWTAHRLQASYLAPASCQVVTFPEDATDRRKRFAAAFLERASAAIEDLEARQALRDYANL